MDLKIFDVEHGACALLTSDNGTRIMIDCGHNASSGWYPGTYLQQQGISQIEMLTVSNYDEDHVSGIENLFWKINVASLTRNPTVSAPIIRKLKSEDGMGNGITSLTNYIETRFTGGSTIGLVEHRGLQQHKWFYNSYPMFDDENNLSLITFLSCHGIGVLFPGDLEAAGWRTLMQNSDFLNALRSTNILVASHHGRKNGWCDELRQYCNPYYVVISDKGYMYDTQETIPLYRTIARGGPFRADGVRRVLTTRNDGRIGFTFTDPQHWNTY